MSHLGFDRIFDHLGGTGTADEAKHLEGCEACRQQLADWRAKLGDLRELEANAVEGSEMHKLRVLFRELGPSPADRGWVARLIRGSQPPEAVAVRGGLSASFQAYEAGPYEVLVQTVPSRIEGRFDVQGQVVGGGGEFPKASQVVLSSVDGYGFRAACDVFGEFRLEGVPEGTCRLVWIGHGERIELDALTVGERHDEIRS